ERAREWIDVELDLVARLLLVELDGLAEAVEPRRLVDDDGDRRDLALRRADHRPPEGRACRPAAYQAAPTPHLTFANPHRCSLARSCLRRASHDRAVPTNNFEYSRVSSCPCEECTQLGGNFAHARGAGHCSTHFLAQSFGGDGNE